MISRLYLFSACLLLLVLSATTWTRLLIYKDEATLWGATVKSAPGKARSHNNYGHGLKEAKRFAEAQLEFEWALRLNPDYPDALNNLATIYSSLGNEQGAQILLHKALVLDPAHIPAKFNLAMSYYESGRFNDALQEYLSIMQLAPYSKEAAFGQRMISLIQRQMMSQQPEWHY